MVSLAYRQAGLPNHAIITLFCRAKLGLLRYNNEISMDASKALYDADGNIILPVSEGSGMEFETPALQNMEEGMWYKPKQPHVRSEMWYEIDEETENFRSRLLCVTEALVEEGAAQYQASIVDGLGLGQRVFVSLQGLPRATWEFLTQPVWVPGRNSEPKQYGRGTLFLLDIVRFGGTFASLFVVLFVSLNYQSFWAIAESYVNPIADLTADRNSVSTMDSTLAEKLKRIPTLSMAGGTPGDLLAALPEVGPPENRLIIPKLGLNVPIVVPPTDHLLKEDWKALEEDIQHGLQDGVVHYPGTARPGQAGNFFVTGHSSYFPWAEGHFKSVFARLGELSVGDEYWVFYGGDKHRYVIDTKKEINPSDVTVLDQPISKRRSSLMTCTPVGTTLRRLIIGSKEVDPVTATELKVGEHGSEQMPQVKMEQLPI